MFGEPSFNIMIGCNKYNFYHLMKAQQPYNKRYFGAKYDFENEVDDYLKYVINGLFQPCCLIHFGLRIRKDAKFRKISEKYLQFCSN
jgi:hypothetical protein